MCSDVPLEGNTEVVVGVSGILDQLGEVDVVGPHELHVRVELVHPGEGVGPVLLTLYSCLEGHVLVDLVLTSPCEG